MIRRFGMMSTWATVIAIAAVAVVPLAGQGSAPKPAAKATSKNYTPARTPWGDPDLQGIYTNKDENGIPMEKPSQFEGKRLEDVDDSEFAEIVRARNEAASHARRASAAPTPAPVRCTGTSTTTRRTAARGWSSIPRTAGFPRRRPRRRSVRPTVRRGEPAAAPPIRTRIAASTISCITRGLPGSMMPAIYGNSYQIHPGPGIRGDPLRDDSRDADHSARRTRARRPRITSYMGDARGHFEATRWSSRPPISGDPNRGASEKLRLVERFKPVAPNQSSGR